jgi:integrase
MKGHIRQRAPGTWAIITDTRDPQTGKRKRRWVTFKGTKRQAQIACAHLVSSIDAGTYLEPSKTTLSTFLEKWLEHKRSLLSPLSHERYCEVARKNVIPLLGAVILTKLRPVQISEAYARALASGCRDGAGGLSAQSVVHMHRLLRQALAQAVKWEMLPRNPTDAVSPPKVERRHLQTYDMEQTVELIDAMRTTRMHVPTLLAALCGLRRGEIAALRWGNVDLFRNMGAQLAVVSSAEQTKAGVRYKEPKSGRSRTVALSSIVVQELRAHRIAQSQELLRVGVRLSDDTFVVAQADGSPLQPRSITHEWVRLIVRTTLPRMRFHDLRHTHATHLLSNGVHPKVASERLGHSKVGITLDLYSHVLPGMQEDAVARVDDALCKAIQKRAAKSVG